MPYSHLRSVCPRNLMASRRKVGASTTASCSSSVRASGTETLSAADRILGDVDVVPRKPHCLLRTVLLRPILLADLALARFSAGCLNNCLSRTDYCLQETSPFSWKKTSKHKMLDQMQDSWLIKDGECLK